MALVVSVGTFAYTFNTTTATLAATVAGAQIATTSNVTSGQPDWQSLLPHSEDGWEILRPDGPGDVTNIQNQQPDSGFHWQKVTEPGADDWATTVYTNGGSSKMDLYSLMDHAQGSGKINGIYVYFRFAGTDGGSANAWATIETGGNLYQGAQETVLGPNFVTKSFLWEINPDTRTAWTWRDIDNLQAGVQLQRAGGGGSSAVCTQVYVMVYYTTPPITKGDVPTGDLFVITPTGNFTGDLTVKIYVTNAGSLNKAYKYLNMKLFVTNSIEAGQTPNYQVLSPENGVVSFSIVGGSAASYTVRVTGGSYSLVSGYTSQWGSGWSIVPEFYCEVTSR